MFTRLLKYLSLALVIAVPTAARAESVCGKIQAIGAESVDDSAYLMVTVQSCQREGGGCRAQALACLLGSPFGRLASALAQSAYLSGSAVVATFDEDLISPLGAPTLRSLTLPQSPHAHAPLCW